MDLEHKVSSKRKHEVEPDSTSLQSHGITVEDNRAAIAPKLTTSSSSNGLHSARAVAVLAACRSALVKGPDASRAALSKHRTFIDHRLAKALEIVGAYDIEGITLSCYHFLVSHLFTESQNSYDTPLHESVRRGDVATTQLLIVAGADVSAKNVKNMVMEDEDIDKSDKAEKGKDEKAVTPVDLATHDNACSDLLEHHAGIVTNITAMPGCLVSSALAHCATLSASKESVPAPVLFLQAYHFDPSFLWAPEEARKLVFKWAKDAFTAQLAGTTQAFPELPDDCAGDVLEYLEMAMPRTGALHIATHCSSPDAQAWIRAVNATAIAEEALEDIFECARQVDVASMKDRLNKGANFDVQFEGGDTVISEACLEGNTGVVRLLLQAGANPNLRTDDRDTALTIATHFGGMFDDAHGYISIVKLLLKAGADVNVQKKNGATPLFDALKKNHSAIVELLLRAGADLETKNGDGSTALIYAAEKCDYAIIELLIEAGANIEARDDKIGDKALMKASARGSTDVVELLIGWGVDINAKNNDGFTALMTATSVNCVDVISALLNVNAHENTKNKVLALATHMCSCQAKVVCDEYGETALDIAKDYGCREAFSALWR